MPVDESHDYSVNDSPGPVDYVGEEPTVEQEPIEIAPIEIASTETEPTEIAPTEAEPTEIAPTQDPTEPAPPTEHATEHPTEAIATETTQPTQPQAPTVPPEAPTQPTMPPTQPTQPTTPQPPQVTTTNRELTITPGTALTEQEILQQTGITAQDQNGQPLEIRIAHLDAVDFYTPGRYAVYAQVMYNGVVVAQRIIVIVVG